MFTKKISKNDKRNALGLHRTPVVSYIILHNRSWSLSVWNCCICCFLPCGEPSQNIYNVTPPGHSRPFFFTCFRTCLQVTGQLNLACLVVAWQTRIKTQKWREINAFWNCLKLIQKRFHRTELDSDTWTLHSGSLSSYNGKMATLGIVNFPCVCVIWNLSILYVLLWKFFTSGKKNEK